MTLYGIIATFLLSGVGVLFALCVRKLLKRLKRGLLFGEGSEYH